MSDEDRKLTVTTGKVLDGEIIELEDDKSTALNRMFWNGNFPTPDGVIAQELAKNSIPIQLMQFATLAELLHNHPEDAKNISLYSKSTAIMFHLPGNARKVRVLHSMDTFKAPDSTEELTHPTITAFAGEYIKDMQFPSIHQLNNDDFQSQPFKAPAQEEYNKAIVSIHENETEDNKIPFKFNKSSLTELVEVSKIQPVPPYLVYDAMDDGIDSIELYERIHHVLEETPTINGAKHFKRLLDFLRVGLVTPTSKQNICFPPEHNLTRPTKSLLMWRREKLAAYDKSEAMESTSATGLSDIATVSASSTMKKSSEKVAAEAPKLSETREILAAATKAGMYKEASKSKASDRDSPPPSAAPASPDSTPSSPGTPPISKPKVMIASSAAATAAPASLSASTMAPVETATVESLKNTLQFNESTFIQLLKLIRINDAGPGASSITAPAGKFETLGLPESSFSNLLCLCGLTVSLRKDIPEMWMRLGESGLNKADKNNIIRHALQNNLLYKNCKVPLIQPIFTMIRDRTFAGEYAVSSLTAAVKGLSPFIVPFLTQLQIDESNKQDENLSLATSIKPQDIAGNRMTCSLPASYDHMVRQIKRFTNLVFALFGEASPLVQALEVVINELEDQTDVAIAKVSKENIASILWIIMLQARHFAAGQMLPADPFIASFQVLINNLEMKNIHGISHGEVPPELYTPKVPSTSNKRSRNDQPQQQEEQRRKRLTSEQDKMMQWTERPEVYNQKLKADMAAIKALKPRPSITKLCKAAGTSAPALFPNNPKVCIRSQIWGACESNCPHQHVVLPDADIDHVRDQLKKVVSNPSLLNKV